ncbi:MAG: YbhB/YbcL family Raf kinase inhibitor-like protein [Bacteroidetes bacterium]|nr:YbhB/YbcL family Raf kinase inhibitor-like protein [Bacteroidota bacterium]
MIRLSVIIAFFIFQKNGLTVKSTAFANGNYIPTKYTCGDANINPELLIEDLPANTVSMALIMDDTKSPNGEFDHWVMWNIPPASKIGENSAPGVQGRNSSKQNKYYGPCPPNGIHTYNFKVFALDTKLDLKDTSGKLTLIKAMEGHIIASGQLKGLYK